MSRPEPNSTKCINDTIFYPISLPLFRNIQGVTLDDFLHSHQDTPPSPLLTVRQFTPPLRHLVPVEFSRSNFGHTV